MKIYTKQGDKGQTALWWRSYLNISISKYIGDEQFIIGCIANEEQAFSGEVINDVQLNCSFRSGIFTFSFRHRIDRISDQEVQYLEQKIDFMEESLHPKNFILPSGSMAGATLHHARTVCRRAERLPFMQQSEKLTPWYFNA